MEDGNLDVIEILYDEYSMVEYVLVQDDDEDMTGKAKNKDEYNNEETRKEDEDINGKTSNGENKNVILEECEYLEEVLLGDEILESHNVNNKIVDGENNWKDKDSSLNLKNQNIENKQLENN